MNLCKEKIDESFVLDADDLDTGMSGEEAKEVFDKELKKCVIHQQYRFGKEPYTDQFLSWFKIYDMGDTGSISQKDFEYVMRDKVGMHYPSTIPVMR